MLKKQIFERLVNDFSRFDNLPYLEEDLIRCN